MTDRMGAGTMRFGRDESDWDVLATAGEEFLIERARLGRCTSYTELNAALDRRTGLRSFDFESQAERAAIGHLLGLIVRERNRPSTGLMISALVLYIDGNDAGLASINSHRNSVSSRPGPCPQPQKKLSG